ncbi:MAG: hypothetical protein ACRBDI_06325 [Alphaproteobacteria bacterium]
MNQEKNEILKQTVIEDEAPKETLAEKLNTQKKKKKKSLIVKSVAFSFIALISYGFYWLLKPFMAYADYGICRTFIELTVSYPETIEVNELSYLRDGSMRLWYTHTDAFGEFRMEPFVCTFEYDQAKQVTKITNIKMGKVNMSTERISTLNNALPYFHANPIILPWPYVTDSLSNVLFDFQGLQKIKFDEKK